MSDPEKSYHFEIVCSTQEKAEELQSLLTAYEIDAKIVMRKKHYVVYVKEGSQIVELLGLTGAHVSLMQLGKCTDCERDAEFCEPQGKL